MLISWAESLCLGHCRNQMSLWTWESWYSWQYQGPTFLYPLVSCVSLPNNGSWRTFLGALTAFMQDSPKRQKCLGKYVTLPFRKMSVIVPWSKSWECHRCFLGICGNWSRAPFLELHTWRVMLPRPSLCLTHASLYQGQLLKSQLDMHVHPQRQHSASIGLSSTWQLLVQTTVPVLVALLLV